MHYRNKCVLNSGLLKTFDCPILGYLIEEFAQKVKSHPADAGLPPAAEGLELTGLMS